MARLTFVQYAGDYREAVRRFDAGGPETYRSQRYSVETLGRLARTHEEVAIVCGITDEAYDERLSNGVRAIGLGHADAVPPGDFVAQLERLRPTHMALMTPLMAPLRWAARHRVETIAVLADSFSGAGLRARFRHAMLARALNARHVGWVGNHALNSCLSLMNIGVRPDKIVPWDWPPATDPATVAPRERGSGPLRLLYVGMIAEAKGVGDVIDAVARLTGEGMAVALTIVGHDPDDTMQAYATANAPGAPVRFAGRVGNAEVAAMMATADAVVVPSRHGYAEGLPMVIYEALSVRTPLIASDHPMFRGAIADGESAVVFTAGDPAALALAIRRLDADPALYARLSSNAAAAWGALQLPVMWADLLTNWLAGDEASTRWLRAHSIASGIYDETLARRRAALAGG